MSATMCCGMPYRGTLKVLYSWMGRTRGTLTSQTGLLQGDVLAPFVFIIVLDSIMNRSAISDPSGELNDLDFADKSLESSIARAQIQLSTEHSRL